VKPVEIHRRMLAQYGQSSMSQRKVCEWVERFKLGRTRVTDEGRSGRPTKSPSRKASSPQDYRKLVEGYDKCIVLQGDSVEK